jgi:hypothetical protein
MVLGYKVRLLTKTVEILSVTDELVTFFKRRLASVTSWAIVIC